MHALRELGAGCGASTRGGLSDPVKTGEPASNVINSSHYQTHNSNGGNQSEITRSSSEPMLTAVMPVIESIGGAGLEENRAEYHATDTSFPNSMGEGSSAFHRRNSEPASIVFGDIFDQLYNNGNPGNGLEDIFADGFHSPPLGATMSVETTIPSFNLGQQPSRPRACSEPSNFDLLDIPEPFPMNNKATLEGQTNLLRPQPSSHLLDTTDVAVATKTGEDSYRATSRHLLDTTTVVVATKTGEDSYRAKHAFARYHDESVCSRQQRSKAPFKRSRSADPLQMQAFIDGNVSYPSEDHQTNNDHDDIFQYLNPEERKQLERLGIYSHAKPKRRRSEPYFTETFLSEVYDGDEGWKVKSSHDKPSIFTSSFSAGPQSEIDSLVKTGHSRQNLDMIQMILGTKKVDRNNYDNTPSLGAASSISNDVRNVAVAQITQALPNHGVSQDFEQYLPASRHQVEPISSQQTQQLSNNDNATNFNPLYTSPMQQNMNMPYVAPNTVTSCASGGPQMISMQQPAPLILMEAVTETQNNLQVLQYAVAQHNDPKAVESIAKAFELTAACSQCVLLLQFQTAHNLLNEAWAHIKIVESRLSSPVSPAGPLSARFGRNQNGHVDKGRNETNTPPGPLRLPHRTAKKHSKTPKIETPHPSELVELPPQCKDDPDIIMGRLNTLMQRTITSQKKLQKYDKQNGLPRSHSQTMVNSSRSRKQLQKGVVLKKWDGSPLIHVSNGKKASEKKDASTIEKEITGDRDDSP